MSKEGDEHLRQLTFLAARAMYRAHYGNFVRAEYVGNTEHIDVIADHLGRLRELFKLTPWTLREIDREARVTQKVILDKFFRSGGKFG